MSLPVRIRPEAAQDLEDAAVWYEEQGRGLGHQFLDEVRRALTRVVEQPQQYPSVHRTIRRALIHRFPFGVFYRVEVGSIVVVAVAMRCRSIPSLRVREVNLTPLSDTSFPLVSA
ncbi:MAG: type II toxin-antitoxin system RelE/ParE family toxin [Xanthomonadales bacterium]|nr:type II toxin-antitoxin system RelE/ParE family toxin [Xanthomonadales bacterium]